MQSDARSVDVIRLANVDPQTAVLAINKLFGGIGDEPDRKAPRVDADVTSHSLFSHGTSSQVEQIRSMHKWASPTRTRRAASRQRGNACGYCQV